MILRFVLLAVVGLTVVYACVFLWARAGLVDRLKSEWSERKPPLPQDTFVSTELTHRLPSLKRKLAIWIYAIPLTVLTITLFALDLA
ncbi:MAG: hypothetical protein AAF919_00090 [Pseudomonadota bacterium]